MSQAELPLAFVAIPIGPLVLAVTMSFVLDPLTDIAVTRDALPDTVAVLDSIDPLSVICIAIDPSVKAFAGYAALIILSQVLIAIAKPLIAFTVALVLSPLAFIDATNFIYANSCSMSMGIRDLTSIK